MNRTLSVLAGLAVIGAGALASVPAGAAAGRAGPDVVVSGLNNPRQLTMLYGSQLLIAEAGRGGTGPCLPNPEGGTSCAGSSGSVSLLWGAPWARGQRPNRVLTGLLSLANPDGGSAVGSTGVSGDLGSLYVSETFAPPDVLGPPLAGQAGHLLKAHLGGSARPYADVSGYEAAHDPNGDGVESNPYAVLALPGRQLVADAAGNSVLEVRNGRVRVFAVFPDHDGHDAVPTSLALGPDGSIYVGELNGFGPGTARVYRLSPSGKLLGWVSGFTTIAGVAVDRAGTLYVSQLFGPAGPSAPPGVVTTVRRDGTRTDTPVPFPSGIALDLFHNVYVSAWSIADADGTDLGGGQQSPPGQVWRLRL